MERVNLIAEIYGKTIKHRNRINCFVINMGRMYHILWNDESEFCIYGSKFVARNVYVDKLDAWFIKLSFTIEHYSYKVGNSTHC